MVAIPRSINRWFQFELRRISGFQSARRRAFGISIYCLTIILLKDSRCEVFCENFLSRRLRALGLVSQEGVDTLPPSGCWWRAEPRDVAHLSGVPDLLRRAAVAVPDPCPVFLC